MTMTWYLITLDMAATAVLAVSLASYLVVSGAMLVFRGSREMVEIWVEDSAWVYAVGCSLGAVVGTILLGAGH